VAWVAALAGGAIVLLGPFRPEQSLGPIENPLGAEGAVGKRIVAATDVGLYVVFAAVILCAFSLVFRYRRAAGIQRQQIKWFAYAAALFGVMLVISLIIDDLLGLDPSIPYMVWVLFDNAPLAALYVAVGIAVLKHRLYDIDLLINRTLVYGSLTAALIAVYLCGIVVLQRLFVVLTGERSTLAIVASTLAIAALFNPLRRRVQGFVDRRFYRRKYDARKTLEEFSAKLRDETDLDALNDDLVGVVRETLQPTYASFWLRPITGFDQVGGERRQH
jgi:hypothetical protein